MKGVFETEVLLNHLETVIKKHNYIIFSSSIWEAGIFLPLGVNLQWTPAYFPIFVEHNS